MTVSATCSERREVLDMRNMKKSNIDTIGEVPANWIQKRLKYLCTIQTGNEDTQNADPDGEYPFYVRSPIVERCNRYTFEGEGILVAGDGAGAGRVFHHVNGKYAVHQRVYRLANFGFNADFIYFYLSNIFPNEMDKGSAQSTVPSMRLPMLMNFPIFLPPQEEAEQIIAYLKSRCTEIDALSAEIQTQIETLDAYKRSVIAEAVTLGLDKNVETKDSGVEWVGEIPASWNVHPVYVYFSERKNKNYALQEQNLLSLSYGKIVRKDIDTVGGLLPASFNTYNIVEAGDIIIRPTDLQNDKRSLRTGLVTERGIITSAYIDLAPKKGINSAYFHYLLHSFDIQKVFYNMGNGVRQGLNYSEFSKLMIFAPSRDEQDAIVDYLDKKCSEIEFIIGQKKEQLEVLTDYKKSLIYEYVTGKKEVPAV